MKLLKLKIDNTRRKIFISDIHGSKTVFVKLLKKIGYSKNDYLFILGDIIERGQDNLETLRYLMKLSETNDVYCLLGNNDNKALRFMEDNPRNYPYLMKRYNTLIREMFRDLKIDYRNITQDEYSGKLPLVLKEFKKEFTFLKKLPLVIEFENYRLTHAGYSKDLDGAIILESPRFYDNYQRFDEKILIVGHYPVNAYTPKITSMNPVIDLERGIICLDGGLTVKEGGQLNALIIDGGEFRYESIDELEECPVKSPQKSTQDEIFSWVYHLDELVEVEHHEDESIYMDCFGRKTAVDNHYIYDYEGVTYCFDWTNYLFNLPDNCFGVKMIMRRETMSLVKVNGEIGWLKNEFFCHKGKVAVIAIYDDLFHTLKRFDFSGSGYELDDFLALNLYYENRLYILKENYIPIGVAILSDQFDPGRIEYMVFDEKYSRFQCKELVEEFTILLQGGMHGNTK